jgi:hypothetical protein
MIISYNFYYARPGNAAAVLQQRIKASDVRAQLGLPRGRVISKIEGGDDFPDVIWRLDFADMAGQDADMRARATSPEFEAIRHDMRQLYRRFERPLYAPHDKNTEPLPAALAQTLFLHGVYCNTENLTAIHEALHEISACRTVRLITDQQNIPQLMVETLDDHIPEILQRLPVRVERSLWRVEDCA